MRKRLLMTLILAQAAASACMDLALLEEMNPYDAATGDEGDDPGGSDGDGDGDADSDADGDGPPATDPDDDTPPAISPSTCDSAESEIEGICVAVGPASFSLRFATDEQAQVGVVVSTPARAAVVSEDWAVEHHAAVVCAGCAVATPVSVRVSDVNGNEATVELEVAVSGGPAIAVTEVLADPYGPEPTQEFVEVVNFGDTSIDLSGWMIDDNMDFDGDVIGSGVVLAARQVGLLASASFDPSEGSDPSPAAGALIIDIGASIASNGLKNTDLETVELYDAGGALISSYGGAAGKPKEGKSAARLFAELPQADPLAWGTVASTPTPGTAPSIP